MSDGQTYDFVIVGSGAGGGPLAANLALAGQSAWLGGKTGRTSSLPTVSTDTWPQVRGNPALRQRAWSARWLS